MKYFQIEMKFNSDENVYFYIDHILQNSIESHFNNNIIYYYHKFIHLPFTYIFLFNILTIIFYSIACQTTNTLKQIFITTMTFILLLDK